MSNEEGHSQMEKDIALLARDVRHIRETLERDTAAVSLLLDRHDKEIYGRDGVKGVRTELSDLKHAEARRGKKDFAIWTALLGLFMKLVYDTFTRGGPPHP